MFNTYLEPVQIFTSFNEVVSLPARDGYINDGLGFETGLLRQKLYIFLDEVVPFL